MKTTTTWTTVVFLFLTALAFAGVPQTMNYQGYLKNTDGTPVSIATSIRFSLYSSKPARNNPVWQETRSVTPANGIYSVQLGSQTPITAPFDVPYHLGVKVAGDNEMALQPLGSVPFAMRAAVADNATSISEQSLATLDSRYNDPTRVILTAQQLATLRWDQALAGSNAINVGSLPSALVFDGTSIWVANSLGNSVQKINPATGAAGAPLSVGTQPSALVFDGSSIWVANYGSNSVQKINPATGGVGAQIGVGTGPRALVFDGSSIWVANEGSGIQKINPATGAVGAAIPVGSVPSALAFDGSSIWVANYTGNTVRKINPATGVVEMQIPVGYNPAALAFDGSSIWVANWGSNTIQKINPATGAVGEEIYVGISPSALAFDGNSIWVANYRSNSVQKINPVNGVANDPLTVGELPVALAFDGSNIWVANSGSDSVTRLLAVGKPIGAQTVGTAQISGTIAAARLDLSTVVSKTGDSMTGPLTLPAGGLSVGTNELVVTGGKVGIGMSSPTEALDVQGNARVNGALQVTSPTLVTNLNSEMVGGQKLADLDNRYRQKVVVQVPRVNSISMLADKVRSDIGTSITIGTDGLPIISYGAGTDLRVFHCSDAACTGGTSAIVGEINAGGPPFGTSIAIGTDGLPVISFAGSQGLSAAHCTDPTCSKSTRNTIASAGFASLGIGSNGLPVVILGRSEAVYSCSDLLCKSASVSIPPPIKGVLTADVPSLAVGVDGFPVFSGYYAGSFGQGSLGIVHCDDVMCSTRTANTIDTGLIYSTGEFSSLAIAADGFPIVSYHVRGISSPSGVLKVTRCNDVACSTPSTKVIVDNGTNVGKYNSLTIGEDGLAVVSYYDVANGDLKVAHCLNSTCTESTTTIVDSKDDVGRNTSITMGADGLPVISYIDVTNQLLKVAKCANRSCVNNLWRR